jgi:hypothetical protein
MTGIFLQEGKFIFRDLLGPQQDAMRVSRETLSAAMVKHAGRK